MDTLPPDTPSPETPPSGAGSSTTPSWLEQDEQLRALWHENKTPEEISAILARSVAAIMTRAARLGLPRRAAPGRKRGYKRTDAPRHEKTVRVRVRTSRTALYDNEEDEAAVRAQVSMRVCLMCLNKFESQGKHNRICPSCKGSAEYVTGSSTPDFTFGGSS